MPVSDDDLERLTTRPELIRVHDDGWRDLHRVPSPTGCGSRCVLLEGDGGSTPFRCTAYELRPTNCRDLEAGSENCHLARRRVGLE